MRTASYITTETKWRLVEFLKLFLCLCDFACLIYLVIYLFTLLIFISPQCGAITLSLAYTCTYACAQLTSVNQA